MPDRARLLLFDIDGTLLSCGPQVRGLFKDALAEVYGTAGDCDSYHFHGRTDSRIVLDLLSGAGWEDAEIRARLPRFQKLYLAALEQGLKRDGMRLLPGVEELLGRLAERRDLTVGLLTGNWEPGARTKLSRFGLNRFFPFGAFGSDATDRDDLPPVALERAARHAGRAFRPEETLIIGDSIYDVGCGHAHGIPVLAVATGRTSAEELEAAGAEWVVPDLTYAAFGAAPGAAPLPFSIG
ncbi:MAG TPA: HAD hydrolase-like protein [Thermoanaerobaculia bacterium]|jgi:phosphoglycolate phosphatase-like HAD superfamily hydrolase|nr:HAD hydrolase-like protein [Thermoanaerobaculia bacterium]